MFIGTLSIKPLLCTILPFSYNHTVSCPYRALYYAYHVRFPFPLITVYRVCIVYYVHTGVGFIVHIISVHSVCIVCYPIHIKLGFHGLKISVCIVSVPCTILCISDNLCVSCPYRVLSYAYRTRSQCPFPHCVLYVPCTRLLIHAYPFRCPSSSSHPVLDTCRVRFSCVYCMYIWHSLRGPYQVQA